MGLLELFILAVGLSMDAFAVTAGVVPEYLRADPASILLLKGEL